LISALVEGKMLAGGNRRSLNHRSIVMGEFIAMSGFKGCTRTDVVRSLGEFALSKNGLMEQASSEAEPFEHLLISGDENGPVTVLYPDDFFGWDEASNFLSVSLGVPVLSLHIHDGDLWMYILFVDGEEVDHFNPISDYWSEELSPDERSLWAGDAEVVAKVWKGVDAPSIEKYLVTWALDDDEPGKAYDSDTYTFNDSWQLTDFMEKLGLSYPIDDKGEAHGERYRFEVKADVE
jgi:hypothetical protein